MPEEPTNLDSADETEGATAAYDRDSAAEESHQDRKLSWRPLAHPYLVKLGTKVLDQGRTNQSITFPIGRFEILATPLDQDLALLAAKGQLPEQSHRLLVADALGLEILIAVAHRKFEKSGDPSHGATGNAVEKGLNLAYRLSHTMTLELHQLTEKGLETEANEVEDSRRRLTSLINDVEQAFKDPKTEEEDKPDQGQFVYQWDSSGSASETTRSPVEVSRKGPTPAPAPGRNGLKGLALAVLVIIFGLVLAQLWLNRPRELRDFSADDFPAVPGIEQVVNRSPVLVIVVSDRQWTAADRFEKKEAIESVVTLIEPAGYRRAEVRSKSNPDLASWNGGTDIVIND